MPCGSWSNSQPPIRYALIPVTAGEVYRGRIDPVEGFDLVEIAVIEEAIESVEAEASSPIYGILKRPDEKYVTEYAYDHPKFVEDLVRDVAARLDADPRIAAYTVEAENFESIHNHSAYAQIECDKEVPG